MIFFFKLIGAVIWMWFGIIIATDNERSSEENSLDYMLMDAEEITEFNEETTTEQPDSDDNETISEETEESITNESLSENEIGTDLPLVFDGIPQQIDKLKELIYKKLIDYENKQKLTNHQTM